VMNLTTPVDDSGGQKQLWEWAERLADPQRSRLYHSALMELGQKICRPGFPDCLSCPIAAFCKASHPERLPVKRQKIRIAEVNEHALWLKDTQDRLLMHRETGKRRQGLWKLPTRDTSEIAELPVLDEHRYTITRYRVTLRVHDGASQLAKTEMQEGEVWLNVSDVLALAMPSPFRRVIERLMLES
jgi:A/G-specific adenine glycosylase